jgi:hypothetical protein
MYSPATIEMDPSCLGMLERPRYFARQLVTPAELNLESEYFAERMRRHNRMLHGWGVVCGAQVCRVRVEGGTGAQPWKVKVRPGFVIDGRGNEVSIGCDRIVDLRSSGVVSMSGDPEGELSDPWCSDVWTERPPGPVWIAVCHKECLARPVRVEPAGCGCDDTSCEYSRWQDGYEIRLLDHCPPSHRNPPTWAEFIAGLDGPLPDCPRCPDDPCVVLAEVHVDADGTITAIDNCSCRRMVASFATFWRRCATETLSIDDVLVRQGSPTPGAKGVRLLVKGTHLRDDATLDFGPGVSVTDQKLVAASGNLNLTIDIASDAAQGERTLTIENPDCSVAILPRALTIAATT